LPKSFVPCTPFGALPSAIELVGGGMFQTSQWVNNPLGASGSSAIKTRLFAFEGTPVICKGGLVSDPSHVNFDGILPPSWKAELVIFILAPSAANEAITASKVTTTPLIIGFRIVRPPIEIALNRQTCAYCFAQNERKRTQD
jgi:hypothetical protein